jgi:hypothetical protein
MSIVEMLVAVTVTGVAIAGLAEMSLLSANWIDKFSNKVDVSTAAKRAIERIGLDLRSARNVGDCSETVASLKPIFPSAQNPIYKTGLPAGALPNYSLDGSTLIIQVPVLDKSGWPTLLPVSVDPKHGPNVDTIVYEVVADSESDPSGVQKYLLRRSVFPGKHDQEVCDNITSGATVCPGQTILKGIIGPLNKNSGKPTIFQAIDQMNPGSAAGGFENLYAGNLSFVGGVAVNIEIMRTQGSSKNDALSVFRSEIHFRNRSIVD